MFPDDAEDKEKTHGITRMDETNIVWQPQILASQTTAETMQRKDNDIFRMNYFPGANITFIFTYMCVCVCLHQGWTDAHHRQQQFSSLVKQHANTYTLCVCSVAADFPPISCDRDVGICPSLVYTYTCKHK